MFAVSARMRAAYCTTSYVVFNGPRRVVLRIGERSAAADRLLGQVPAAVFVTACNPLGRAMPAAWNGRAMRRLRVTLRREGVRCLDGVGVGDDGGWTPEPSLLVFIPGRHCAAALGRRLRQNAVVLVRRRTPAELVGLR